MIRVENIKWSVDEKEDLKRLPVNVTISGDDEEKLLIES